MSEATNSGDLADLTPVDLTQINNGPLRPRFKPLRSSLSPEAEHAIKQLEDCRRRTYNAVTDEDIVYAHRLADNALCELLVTLGYRAVVEEFNAVGSWEEN
jgi:hypothetical protein